jgi:HEPN domain-containing protein
MLCFHAQQAAEKSIKAVLLDRGIYFPWTHNLELLTALLPADLPRSEAVAEAGTLTVFATLTRYPRGLDEATEADYRAAVRRAAAIYAWARQVIGTAGQAGNGDAQQGPGGDSSEGGR